jgi:PleD family two-component response regulator
VDQLHPGDPDCSAAVTRADQKLYRAKAAGRNRVI